MKRKEGRDGREGGREGGRDEREGERDERARREGREGETRERTRMFSTYTLSGPLVISEMNLFKNLLRKEHK